MNQLEERKNYEERDLMDFIRTVIKRKETVILFTIVFSIVAVFGGYFYNKSKKVTTTVLTLDYPGREIGKTPDGALLTTEEIIPVEILNSVYSRYKDEIKEKDEKKFIDNTELVWMVPPHIKKRIEDAANRGEKYLYTPTDFAIVSKENKKVVDAIASDAVAQFIKRYRPYYVIEPLKINPDYDYPVDYDLINDKITALKVLIKDREEKKFISNKVGFSFDKILQNLDSLEKIEVQDFYSYYTGHQLSLDAKTRALRFKSDIQILTFQRDGLQSQAAIIKKMIDEYKPSEKSFVVANVGELDKAAKQNDDYYGKMIDQYLEINKEIIDKDIRIKRLQEESKIVLNYPTDAQRAEAAERLDAAVTRLNKIIDEVNEINDEYTRVTYANMISISSPVITTTTGKPLYMYLAVGIVLGICFGIFMAFVAEFREDYKRRYSK